MLPLQNSCALCTSALLLYAHAAHANPIAVHYHETHGLWMSLPVAIFVLAAETFVYRHITGLGWKRSSALATAANALSTLAGCPLMWYFSSSDQSGFGLNQYAEKLFYESPGVVELASLFLVSLLTEGLVLLCWHKRSPLGASPQRLASALLLANISTYTVLVPLLRLLPVLPT